jgi:hypothetical protein
MHLAGPEWLRLVFQGFVVLVGFLILAGAVNTSIVGSNGVLNRVSEDGVLTPWFRRPHARFGTSYRIINLVTLLQLATILLSRGEVYLLGEAYAFGVVWSFSFNGLAVLVLRFKQPGHREWRVPLNLKVGKTEWPVGLGLITLVLFAAAIVNLFTKQVATISGLAFTLGVFALFVTSERAVTRQQAAAGTRGLDQFQLLSSPDVGLDLVSVRPGNILVPVRNYNTLAHLDAVLAQRDDRDIAVMTARLLRGPGAGMRDIAQDDLFTDYERVLFTRVVSLAERHGRSVRLLIVPAADIYDAVVQTAVRLQSSEIAFGESAKMSTREQARLMGEAWDRTPRDQGLRTRAVVYREDGGREVYRLGVHAPELAPEDLERIHRLWVDAAGTVGPDLHHRDIVVAALAALEQDLSGADREAALARIRAQMGDAGGKPSTGSS